MAYDAIEAWQQANQGNSTVQAAAHDLFYNSLAANLSTQSAVSYANQMTPIALRYQQASTNIAQEADLRRLGAETSAARGLMQQQGDIQFRSDRLAANTTRYGFDQQLKGVGLQTDAQRYGYELQLQGVGLQTEAQRFESKQATQRTGMQETGATQRTGMETETQRYGFDRGLEGQKYSADRGVDSTRIQADAQRYGADRGLDGIKYGADRNLEGIRATNQSDEDKIRISGGENRKTLTQGTDETLRLRSDARGAIRSAGKSFYG